MEMFTFDKKKKYTSWVEFSDDEKYLVKYWPQSEYVSAKGKETDDGFVKNLLDWSGVSVSINGKEEPVDCTDENKKEIFIKNFEHPDVAKRVVFLIEAMTSPRTFFDVEEKLKN